MGFPTDERSARILLNLCPLLGPVRTAHLLDRFGSAANALTEIGAWITLEDLGTAARLAGPAVTILLPTLEKELAAIQRLGARVLIATDAEYPEAFRRLADGPLVLYLWGCLVADDERSVALVGSRSPTVYGRSATERLARELTEARVPVVSGLARGVDTVAHTTVVATGGRTIGILGSGLNRFYPPENRRLADTMAESGAVISEFFLEASPDASHFPRRNRLIAALSAATVVVEAKDKSGALITAGLAAALGRDVFAVPGSIFSPLSRGPFRLLRDGAAPVESAEDVLAALPHLRREETPAELPSTFAPSVNAPVAGAMSERVMGVLSDVPLPIDEVVARVAAPVAEVAGILLRLEMEGRVVCGPGKYYTRTERSLPGGPHAPRSLTAAR